MTTANTQSTSALLKQLKKLVTSGGAMDHHLVASLVQQEPKRWMSLLLLNSVIPDPQSGRWHSSIRPILEGMRDGLSDALSVDVVLEVSSVLVSLMTLGTSYDALRQQLDTVPLWDRPALAIYRLGAFLESQAFIASRKHAASMPSKTAYDPVAALRSIVPGPTAGAAKLNFGQFIEEMHEVVELIVRYIFHKHVPSVGFGDLYPLATPYEDAHLDRLIRSANVWRMYDELWARIKFLGWLPAINGEKTAYTPPDMDEFMRAETGKVRENAFTQQVLMSEWVLKEVVDTDTDARLNTLAASILLPSPGAAWDGKIDVAAMQRAAAGSTWLRAAEYYIKLRNYSPLLSEVRFGAGAGWGDWMRGINIVNLLAAVFQRKAWSTVSNVDGDGCLGSVFVLHRDSVRDLLVQVAGVTQHSAEELVDSFSFDAKRKHREIWDQPLLPIGDRLVLLVPSIAVATSPVRAVENLITDAGNSFSVAGKPFEAWVEQVLIVDVGAQAEGGLKFLASDGRQVEFDLIAWWQGHLLLIETKCLKSIHSAADQHRAREEVIEAIDQLARRRRLALSDWDVLCKNVSRLTLPDTPPDSASVICIALTNSLQFTGLESDGILVTDDLCFRRFFGNPEIAKLSVGADGLERHGTVGHIRKGPATPAALVEYLRDPPQVRAMRSLIKPAWLPIPAGKDGTKPLLMLSSEFSGTVQDLVRPNRRSGTRLPSEEEIAKRRVAKRREKQKQIRKKKKRDGRKH